MGIQGWLGADDSRAGPPDRGDPTIEAGHRIAMPKRGSPFVDVRCSLWFSRLVKRLPVVSPFPASLSLFYLRPVAGALGVGSGSSIVGRPYIRPGSTISSVIAAARRILSLAEYSHLVASRKPLVLAMPIVCKAPRAAIRTKLSSSKIDRRASAGMAGAALVPIAPRQPAAARRLSASEFDSMTSIKSGTAALALAPSSDIA